MQGEKRGAMAEIICAIFVQSSQHKTNIFVIPSAPLIGSPAPTSWFGRTGAS
jgi:hypothetical protein